MSSSTVSDWDRIYREIGRLSPERLELLKVLLTNEGLDVSETLIVPRSSEEGPFPLSFAQRRLWFVNQLQPENNAYNIAIAVRLRGSLTVEALRCSLSEIVRRHETLRATFQTIEGRPVQVVNPVQPLSLPLIALDGPSTEIDDEALRIAIDEAGTPFDLLKGPLLRSRLLRLKSDEHVLLLTMHHIIADGWSLGILVDELRVLYEAYCAGKPSPLPELLIQSADFARWQNERLQGELLEKNLAYWQRQLRQPLAELELPANGPRPAVQSFRGATESLMLSQPLSDSLQALSERQRVTLFMTLLAAFNVLLHSYSGQRDIVVGTGVANRDRAETERLIGCFVNLLVLRTDLSGGSTFIQLLDQVKEVTIAGYAHQELPFERLVDELDPQRSLDGTPIIRAVFVLQNAPLGPLELSGLTLIPWEIDNGTTRFDLTLFIHPTSEGLKAKFQYSTDIFSRETIVELLDRYQVLLSKIVAQPTMRISELVAESGGKELRETDKSTRLTYDVEPKAVTISDNTLVRTRQLHEGQNLPLLIQPFFEDLDVVDWAAGNREFLERHLLKNGGLLLRGFNLNSVKQFEDFARAFTPNLYAENGELERTNISSMVYSPVNYPADQAILWHNENSFCPRWPLKIWFLCLQPAAQGGETPIVDSRRVYQKVPARICEQFAQKGIMYLRNYRQGLGLTWQQVFQTQSRAEVEEHCKRFNIDFEWKGPDHLTTRSVRPAVARHPRTDEMVWFNQVCHWHISCLDQEARESMLLLFKEKDLPRHAYYGDGTPIGDDEIAEVVAAYKEAEVVVGWQKGDILMLDNMLTAHARRPFSGERKMAVTMGEMITSADLERDVRSDNRV